MDVLWLGGGCGAGKSTVARRLAYRFDLRLYPLDAYGWVHDARLSTGQEQSFEEKFVSPTPHERAATFLAYAERRFPLIDEDLAALGAGPLILAEGPGLLPEPVAARMASPAHGLWLLPSAEFSARNLGLRAEPQPTEDAEAKAQATRVRLARDELLVERMRADAARLGLPTWDVDGSWTLEETEERVARLFAPLIEAGPRVRDGAERAAIRRAENAVVKTQIEMFLRYLGEHAPAEPAPFPWVCECSTLGCAATVPLPVTAYAPGAVLAH
ncbi:P-loop NTPase family protein [Hamadaea tsunoensis]|uniref:hypothetical protein n=1 Tax=Hamadaea tsunoensis TaxID=53368 RepID=UPI0003FC32A1|nr:hypothetical protein [Hamadaea tsunoensis]